MPWPPAGLDEVEAAVVSIGENIEASVLVVMLLREPGTGTIIAKAVTPQHGRILEKLVRIAADVGDQTPAACSATARLS